MKYGVLIRYRVSAIKAGLSDRDLEHMALEETYRHFRIFQGLCIIILA